MLIGVCYPGWQLPVWFNHRTFGSELTQKLPRHWNEDGLTGIALCVVVSFKDYQAQNNHLLVRCTSEFEEKGESLIQFSCILGGWTEDVSDRPHDIIKSDGHVFIGYTSLLDIKRLRNRGSECVDTEASFKFEVTDGTKQITNCEVIKCGFSLIYAAPKHAHSICSEKRSDHGKIMSGGKTFGPYIQREAASSSNGEGSKIGENLSRQSISPERSEDGEVVDEKSPKNEGVGTRSSVCSEETDISDNGQSLSEGANNLYDLLEKPIRLICIVISIYAGAAFVLHKDKRKR